MIRVWRKLTSGILVAESFAARVAAALDRLQWLILILLVAAWLAATATAARLKPFWHDEIYTILLARLPSTEAVWAAMGDGADLSAPLNTLLTRGVHAVAGVGHVSTRLPALAGTVLMIAVLFAFVRRRADAAMGAAAVVLVSYTAAYRYSYEARGYGLMLGFFMLALFCWAEAASGKRRMLHVPLMAIALAGSYWSHYFGVFALAPIGAGELLRATRRGRPDAAVWLAAIASLLAIVPLLGLVQTAQAQSDRFWSRAAFSDIRVTYAFVLHELFNRRLRLAALAAVAVCALGYMTRAPGIRPQVRSRGLPAHEYAAIVTCLLLPILEIAGAVATSGIFVTRYALPLVIGAALALPLGIWQLAGGTRLAPLVFALVLTTGFGTHVYASLTGLSTAFVSPVNQRHVLTSALHEPKPVVVTGGLMFLQLWNYTVPADRGRLWYLADPREAYKYTGADTIDRGLIALGRWAPVNVAEYHSFTTRHSEFHVYTAGSGWLLNRLAEDGVAIEEIAREPGGKLLLVRIARIALHATSADSSGKQDVIHVPVAGR